jgi:CubicO group peptidase (beta-lactamase class C family)
MNNVLKAAAAVLVLLVLAAALWAFRPWSEYSPFETVRLAQKEDRVPIFRAMEKTYPHRLIGPSETVYTFPRTPLPIDPVYSFEGDRRTLADYAEDKEITGLMVVSSGKVVLERYYRGETPTDRHTSWSVAKSVIASLIGHALLEGKIESLDDKAADYAEDYAGTAYGDTTIRHLLMMSSGIDFEEEYERADGDARRLFIDTMIFRRDIDESLAGLARDRPAGEDFHYISPNSAVLAAVLSGAYQGMRISTIVERELFQPLGVTGGSWLLDRVGEEGKELGYCCLQLTLEDYAKLGQLYLQDGVVGRNRILPEGWTEFVSTAPQASHEPGGEISFGDFGYGHHFWLPPQNEGEYMMVGYNGQVVWIDPRRDVVIAMTGADKRFNIDGPEFVPMMRALAKEAAALRQS